MIEFLEGLGDLAVGIIILVLALSWISTMACPS